LRDPNIFTTQVSFITQALCAGAVEERIIVMKDALSILKNQETPDDELKAFKSLNNLIRSNVNNFNIVLERLNKSSSKEEVIIARCLKRSMSNAKIKK